MSVSQFARLGTAVAAASLFLCALPAQAATHSGLFAFGDSLSDNGNVLALTGGATPGAPYVGGRFSNGMVAVEYLAQNQGLALYDYAYGGATTGYNNINAGLDQIRQFVAPGSQGTGLRAQVDDFALAPFSPADRNNGLYFVMAGGNDFLSPAPGLTVNQIIGNAIGNLVTSVGTQLSLIFNQLLVGAYANLANNLSGETFHIIDSVLMQTSGIASFVANGGTASASCVDQLAFPNCTGYYYFDDIHPTTAAHQLFAEYVSLQVPEPASWGLAGLALLGVGVASRRRQAASA